MTNNNNSDTPPNPQPVTPPQSQPVNPSQQQPVNPNPSQPVNQPKPQPVNPTQQQPVNPPRPQPVAPPQQQPVVNQPRPQQINQPRPQPVAPPKQQPGVNQPRPQPANQPRPQQVNQPRPQPVNQPRVANQQPTGGVVPPIKPATPVKTAQPSPNTPPQKPTFRSKMGLFFKNFFRWTLLVIDLIAIGIALTIILLYVPKRNELTKANADLVQVHQTATAVQSTLDQSKQASQTLNQQNTDQAAQSKTTANHVALLQAMNSISTARAALASDDIPGAKKALDAAPGQLSTALANAPIAQADLAKTIQTRFDLVRGELERDPTTTASDIKILSDKLSELENNWFGH